MTGSIKGMNGNPDFLSKLIMEADFSSSGVLRSVGGAGGRDRDGLGFPSETAAPESRTR